MSELTPGESPPPIGPIRLDYASAMPPPPNVRWIAVLQRALLRWLLAILLLVVLIGFLPNTPSSFCYVVLVVSLLVVAAITFMLGIEIYGAPLGILAGLGSLIVCVGVGVIVVLIVNYSASRLLRRHGFQVGIMGAGLEQFEPK
ncbi:MAG: hypothetical protein M3O30_06415 [Planctomycetota bacterium]|nr:hypothetical protein [Planctomycetota bacterium]